eukprot:NODE_996_length_2421_cov_0.527993.p1 type:complete len:127 gc:universal NODE_996_length_2421_cov_0.527993:1122-742(-)
MSSAKVCGFVLLNFYGYKNTSGTSNIKTGLTFCNNLGHYFSFINLWIQEASGHSASCGVDEYKRKINNFLYRNFKNKYSVQLFSYSFIRSLFQTKYHYYSVKTRIDKSNDVSITLRNDSRKEYRLR